MVLPVTFVIRMIVAKSKKRRKIRAFCDFDLNGLPSSYVKIIFGVSVRNNQLCTAFSAIFIFFLFHFLFPFQSVAVSRPTP